METFHEKYFEGVVDFKGDALEVMENRHDWANFRFTISVFRFFLTGMMPEVLMHTRSQGMEAVASMYDTGTDPNQMRSKYEITMTVGTISMVGFLDLA